MSIMITDSQHYSDIADSIRTKLNTQTTYKPEDMAAGITSIPAGTPEPIIEFLGTDGIKQINNATGAILHNYDLSSLKTSTIPACAFKLFTTLTTTGNIAKKLISVTGLDKVRKVGAYAFGGEIYNDNLGGKGESGAHALPIGAGPEDTSRVTFEFPNLEIIGEGAFCVRGLTNTIKFDPTKITYIGDYAFADSVIPYTMDAIFDGDYNFNVLTYLGSYAFAGLGNDLVYNFNAPMLTEVKDHAFQVGVTGEPGVGGSFFLASAFNAPLLKDIGACAFKNQEGLTKIWIKSGGTIVAATPNDAPFGGCDATALEIWTDAASADAGWGTYWDKTNTSTSITVHYGATYQDYLNA